MRSILFVCVENACRSQMAEGFARTAGVDAVAVYSAGSKPSGKVNPDAIAVMEEIGIDISSQRSKGFADLPVPDVDVIVTMGCEQTCPAFPAKERVGWSIEDPKGRGPETFRRVRDDIRAKVTELLASLAEES